MAFLDDLSLTSVEHPGQTESPVSVYGNRSFIFLLIMWLQFSVLLQRYFCCDTPNLDRSILALAAMRPLIEVLSSPESPGGR